GRCRSPRRPPSDPRPAPCRGCSSQSPKPRSRHSPHPAEVPASVSLHSHTGLLSHVTPSVARGGPVRPHSRHRFPAPQDPRLSPDTRPATLRRPPVEPGRSKAHLGGVRSP